MSKLGIFVDRKTLSSSSQLMALVKIRDVAESMGHTAEFIFPVDIKRIPKLDALFIRANTDPMNITYVAARMAQMYGIPVIDDPMLHPDLCGQDKHVHASHEEECLHAQDEVLEEEGAGRRAVHQTALRGAGHASGVEGAVHVLLGQGGRRHHQ